MGGRNIRLDVSAPRPPPGGPGNGKGRVEAPTSSPSDSLFIGNLAFGVAESSVKAIFAPHGEVLSVRIPTDRDSGKSKGFGYVQFENTEAATKALEALNGSQFEGRSLRIDYSGPKPEGREGSFRGRGGGERVSFMVYLIIIYHDK